MSLPKIIFSWLIVLLLAALGAGPGAAWWYAGYLSEPVLQPVNSAYEGRDALPASAPGMKLTPFTFEGWDGTSIQACIAEKAEEDSPRQVAILAERNKQRTDAEWTSSIDYVLVSVDWDHGIQSSLELAEALTASNLKCVLWDPRGINSARRYCSHGLRESGDVPLLLTELIRREKGRELVVAGVGRGFGASLLIQAAARDPRLRSLVAIDVYKTLKEAVRSMLGEEVPQWLIHPAFWLMEWKINSTAGYECFDVAPIESAPAIDRDVAALLVDSGAEPHITSEGDASYIYLQMKCGVRDIWALRTAGDPRDAETRNVEIEIGKNKKGARRVESIPVRLFNSEDELYLNIILWLSEHTALPSSDTALPESYLIGIENIS